MHPETRKTIRITVVESCILLEVNLTLGILTDFSFRILKYTKKPLLLCDFKEIIYICSRNWELSSAGSEHLPYKQGVTGSNPVVPTAKQKPGHVVIGFCVFRGSVMNLFM